MRTLYVRILLTTLAVMALSFILSFIASNVYYHFVLKPQNDARITETAESIQSFSTGRQGSLEDTLAYTGELGYQLALYSTGDDPAFFGSSFRDTSLSPDVVERVLNGSTYHGVEEHRFGLFVTGFFHDELGNTIGVPLDYEGSTYALFVRPDIESQMGEFRLFLAVLLGLMVVVTVFSVVFSTRFLVRPIESLTDAAKTLQHGTFDIELKSRRRDEIGQLARQFSVMSRDLGRLDQMRREFVANVSHEIQSPLTRIQGLSSSMRDSALTEAEREQYIKAVEEETTRLSSLTRQLLTLASLDQEDRKTEQTSFSLSDQLQDVISSLHYHLQQKELYLETDIEEVTIVGEPQLLHQVWYNLIHNAVRYTPEGGSIYVESYQDNRSTVIVISDTGAGMEKDTVESAFQRFYKEDASRGKIKDSHGLGLSIAYRIVELHAGTIKVESTKGEGTTFTVRLPFSP